MATAMPILTAILVLTLHFLRNRIRPSGAATAAVAKSANAAIRCAARGSALRQCVNVFIRRSGVDAQGGRGKEYAIEAYHRRRHLTARALAVLSGAGHVMMGHTVRGLAFLLVTASLLASVVLWRGVAREPLAIPRRRFLLRVRSRCSSSPLCTRSASATCWRASGRRRARRWLCRATLKTSASPTSCSSSDTRRRPAAHAEDRRRRGGGLLHRRKRGLRQREGA